MGKLTVSIIVAVAENGVIGDGFLPWHLSSDLIFFKKMTLGHPVIMGRKTYESIGRALPGRTNIILSRQKDYIVKDCLVANNIIQALSLASEKDEICFIIGGQEVYHQSIGFVDTMYVTEVHCSPIGDSTFIFDKSMWQEIDREEHEADSKNEFSSIRITYRRIK